MTFKRMTLKTKMILGYAAILALTGVLGILALMLMARVNQASTIIVEKRLPSVFFTSDINTATADFRVAELEHILAVSEESQKQYEQVMQEILQSIAERQTNYKPLISSPEANHTYENFVASWERYLVEHEKILALSRQNRSEEAKLLVRGESQQIYEEASSRLLELVNLNVSAANQASLEGDQLYAFSQKFVIGIILVSLLSAGAIAFLQIRSILTQVGGEPAVIAELTTKIARGEFSVQSAESGKQETGIFAAVTNMSSQIQSILQEINFLIGAIQDGKLDTRGDAQAFNGGWQELVMGINSVIDAFMGPFNQTAEYIERIARGDIPHQITEEARGDFNEVKRNMNMLIDAMNTITTIAEEISNGNLTGDVQARSEHDQLMKAMNAMIQRLKAVLHETEALTVAIQEGKLDTRGNTTQFIGTWRDMVAGINNVVDAFMTPFNLTTEYVERIAKGDIPGEITEDVQGDFNELKQNLNLLIGAMNSITLAAEEISDGNLTRALQERSDHDRLIQAMNTMVQRLKTVLNETGSLTIAIQDGKLETRGNTDQFTGTWRDMMTGINKVIDAFVAPFNVTAEYLERIAKGDIPKKIEEEYRGDFNEIKNNINLLIDAMNEITALAEQIAAGNVELEVKQRSDQDQLMKALDTMLQRLNAILQEMNKLILAAQDGVLNTRGNADIFIGAWRDQIIKMNNLIEAFMKPIDASAEIIDRIAKGDIPEKITDEYRGDFNKIKKNLNILIDAMNTITRLAKQMAEGDLTVEVQERSEQDELMEALNNMIQRLNEVLTNVKLATNNVATSSQQMSFNSEQMSQGATEQAASAEEASASMEQMVANIQQNTENASQTEKIAVKAAEDARESGRAASETVEAMQEIAKRISVVEDIARQTRLLSLNATIEAAKAQEHGRGFAVVASEVRSLAERTQETAKEINALANSSLKIAGNAGEMLTKLVPNIQKTAELVQEISAASKEQNTGASQINQAIQQLDSVIQQNSSTSEDLASTSEELATQAQQLLSTIQFFKVQEDDYTSSEPMKLTNEKKAKQLKETPLPKTPHFPAAIQKKKDKNKKQTATQSEIEGDINDSQFERF